jgi:CRISPR/Cas system CSM-associated protein Csm2 small subunit
MKTKPTASELKDVFYEIIEERVKDMIAYSNKTPKVNELEIAGSIKDGYIVVHVNGYHYYLFLLGINNQGDIKIREAYEATLGSKYIHKAEYNKEFERATDKIEQIISYTPQRERKEIVKNWLKEALEKIENEKPRNQLLRS